MLKRLFLILCLLAPLGGAQAQTYERPRDLPTDCRDRPSIRNDRACFDKASRINDLGNVLGSTVARRGQNRIELTQAFKALERKTGAQVAFVSVPKLARPLSDFSLETARWWGLGRKGYSSDGKNNGLLIAAFVEKVGETYKHTISVEIGDGLYVKLGGGTLTGKLEEFLALSKDGDVTPTVERLIGQVATMLEMSATAPSKVLTEETGTKSDPAMLIIGAAFVLAAFLGLIHWSVGGITGAIGAPLAIYAVHGASVPILIASAIGGFFIGAIAWFLFFHLGFIPGLGGGSNGDGLSTGGGSFSGSGGSGSN